MPSKPESTVQAFMSGLDPTEGKNPFEQVGPLIAFAVYVGAILLMAFDVVPKPDLLQGLLALLGPAIGAWATKLGLKG